MKKIFFSLASVIIMLLLLVGCGDGTSNKSLQKMLKNSSDFSDVSPTSAKIISEKEIPDAGKLLFFSAKGNESDSLTYFIALSSNKGNGLQALEYTYSPLEIIHNEITCDRTQTVNMAYFDKLVTCFTDSGTDYFSKKQNEVEFLRVITGEDGVISTATAQKIISDTIQADPMYTDEDEFWMVFEEGNANPLCYAIKSRNDYTPGADGDYKWIAYSLDGNMEGTYDTKSELYTAITGESAEFDEEKERKGSLKLATVSDRKPFAYLADGDPTGADIDIARAIADVLNMELEISVVSSESAISGTGAGTFDMAMAAFTTDTKGSNITFTDNYYGNYVIVLNRDNADTNAKICSALSEINSNGTSLSLIQKHSADKANASNGSSSKAESPVTPQENNPVKPDEKTDQGEPVISYRVRKSADDYKSQIGAFAGLENAKKEANAHKDDGYKVYDMSGKLIYTP